MCYLFIYFIIYIFSQVFCSKNIIDGESKETIAARSKTKKKIKFNILNFIKIIIHI